MAPTSLSNHAAEYAVIVSYLVLMVVIGFVFRGFNKNVGDYFRSGSQATWWLVGVSSFMSGISAVTFTGYAGSAFKAGWSVLAVYLGNVVGILIQAAILAPWFRQLRATTFPEVLRARFGPSTQQFYAYSKVITFTLYASLWLLGLASFSASTFGLPMHLMIPGLGIVALLYPLLGGKWAVMAADFIKGLILMTVTIFLSLFCLYRVGGFGGLTAMIKAKGLEGEFAFIKPAGAFPGDLYTWQWALAVFLISVVVNCGAANAMKYFAVKDGREARRAAFLSASLMAAGVVFWFIPPMTARVLFESEVLRSGLTKPEEASIAIVTARLLPAGMIGMMVVAMFSATMSAMDIGINGNAAIVVKDVLPAIMRWFKRGALSESAQMAVSKISTLFFGVLIIVLAMHFAGKKGVGLLDLILNIGSAITVPLTIPTILGLFIRRVPPWAALFSVFVAAIPSLLEVFQVITWTLSQRTFWTMILGTAGFLITTVFWKRTEQGYRDQVDEFFGKMHRPIDYDTEVRVKSDGRQLLVIGRLSLVVSSFVLVLLFIPNPPSGRLAIGALALVIGTVGALLLRSGRRFGRPQ